MKNTIFFALLAMFLVAGCGAFAQTDLSPRCCGRIEGILWDSVSQESLPFGLVWIITPRGDTLATVTDDTGYYSLENIPFGRHQVVADYVGFPSNVREIIIKDSATVRLDISFNDLSRVEASMDVIMCAAVPSSRSKPTKNFKKSANGATLAELPPNSPPQYQENDWMSTKKERFSSFSADVDRASYGMMRKMIELGEKVDPESVRIEEFINYFSYKYPIPDKSYPISTHTELSDCAWNPQAKLLKIGLQTAPPTPIENSVPNNLVFLLDVSGSMYEEMPLMRKSLHVLLENLTEKDRVAIVVYAGAAGLVLPSTSGADKTAILEALDALQAGGSTAGGEGIKLAYKIARENRTEGSNDRVVLITDGDFNVGVSTEKELEALVVEQRKDGIFLTGVGMSLDGGYSDKTLETLADKGNGNYAFVDSEDEAYKFFRREFQQTMRVAAKDVKIQLEFDPRAVRSYRLVGYENRILSRKEFRRGKTDAGDMGAGHQVTALYEIMLADSSCAELGTLRLRCKAPRGTRSRPHQTRISAKAVPLSEASADFRWASSVAGFGMWLRNSQYQQSKNPQALLQMAESALGEDPYGDRAGFLELFEMALEIY